MKPLINTRLTVGQTEGWVERVESLVSIVFTWISQTPSPRWEASAIICKAWRWSHAVVEKSCQPKITCGNYFISPFHSRCFDLVCKIDRWSRASLGTNISFHPDECCWRHQLFPGVSENGQLELNNLVLQTDQLRPTSPHTVSTILPYTPLRPFSAATMIRSLLHSPSQIRHLGFKSIGQEKSSRFFCLFFSKHIFYTPRMCGQCPYSLGWKFRTDHYIHRDCGVDVAASPFTKTKDDQVFGKWKRDVDLKTLSVGFAADKTRLSRCVDVKDSRNFSVSALPDELTRGVTRRPQHVKAQLPHVVCQEDARASRAPSTHLLLVNRSGAREKATQFIN